VGGAEVSEHESRDVNDLSTVVGLWDTQAIEQADLVNIIIPMPGNDVRILAQLLEGRGVKAEDYVLQAIIRQMKKDGLAPYDDEPSLKRRLFSIIKRIAGGGKLLARWMWLHRPKMVKRRR
jgi:hypothetical protein